ncbi:TPA: hypothetical protein IFD62_000400 [Escherichia coli]|nr:hypothetical protein [Escherichia coli]TZC61933.1 hypothetical protein E0J33_13295 [Escherichia coli]HAN4697689.1 hypothetical protein [Escherichia coli]HBN4943563.1 hypothetical protein [Escherichia coli]
MTTSEKYWWILGHPKFINKDMVPARIDIEPHDVCPMTNRIEDFKALNTKTQFWVEFLSPMYIEQDDEWVQAHDYQLDCGGDTYEEAIDELYKNVLNTYGDYTQQEADDKFHKIHSFNASQSIYNPAKTVWEERHSWSSCVIDEETKEKIIDDIKNLKNTIQALRAFIKSCTIEEQQEAKIHLESEECKLWVLEKSLEKGIDLDL